MQGASWALVFIGAFYAFSTFVHFGFLIALLSAFAGSLFGLFGVIITELALLQIEKLNELKKHTSLFEAILQKLQNDTTLPHN
ncbi:MAG: hypothetical protein IBX44_02330 [Sulfurospirillum sp.]|nr:hypothetical protein [Sulfurospirillum sp.]